MACCHPVPTLLPALPHLPAHPACPPHPSCLPACLLLQLRLPKQSQLDDVPIYAHPKLIRGAHGGVEALEISFLTLYAYNGEYRVGGLPFLTTGAHDGDWEHCTAR